MTTPEMGWFFNDVGTKKILLPCLSEPGTMNETIVKKAAFVSLAQFG